MVSVGLAAFGAGDGLVRSSPRGVITSSLVPPWLRHSVSLSTSPPNPLAPADGNRISVHTHVYTPRLVALLRGRSQVPRIHGHCGDEKLAILADEPGAGGGRPVGPQYWDRSEKLKFMQRHGISTSVISVANPWVDWLENPFKAVQAAQEANADLIDWCAGEERMKAFGLLPLAPGVAASEVVKTAEWISANKASGGPLVGAILGTRGLGRGLDDPALEGLWSAAEKGGLTLFIHPHYGVAGATASDGLWGKQDNGHVLPLALGFPYETAAAASRLILAGVLDRFADLKLLLAHSGGALPALASRLASCVAHDPAVHARLSHDPRYYLGRLYFDSVAYGPEELMGACAVVGRAARYTGKHGVQSGPNTLEGYAAEVKLGAQRFFFGTDHPFFPPLNEADVWTSVTENVAALQAAPAFDANARSAIAADNATRVLGL